MPSCPLAQDHIEITGQTAFSTWTGHVGVALSDVRLRQSVSRDMTGTSAKSSFTRERQRYLRNWQEKKDIPAVLLPVDCVRQKCLAKPKYRPKNEAIIDGKNEFCMQNPELFLLTEGRLWGMLYLVMRGMTAQAA